MGRAACVHAALPLNGGRDDAPPAAGRSDMTQFLFFIDSLSTWVGKAFAWLILVLTLGISYEVFVRYVLRAPTTWAFDFSYITYGALFLMAGAYTLVAQRACARRRALSLLEAAHAGHDGPGALHPVLPSGGGRLDLRGLGLREVLRPVPRGQHLQPGGRSGVSPQGADPGRPACCCCCRASPRSSAASSASASGAWPQRLHDVEETESIIMHEQQHAARARRAGRAAAGPQGELSNDRSSNRHV